MIRNAWMSAWKTAASSLSDTGFSWPGFSGQDHYGQTLSERLKQVWVRKISYSR